MPLLYTARGAFSQDPHWASHLHFSKQPIWLNPWTVPEAMGMSGCWPKQAPQKSQQKDAESTPGRSPRGIPQGDHPVESPGEPPPSLGSA